MPFHGLLPLSLLPVPRVLQMAVVPWSWFDFSDPERLEALIAELRTEEGRAKTARLNGMVPRSVPEIPHAVPILRELEGNVRATHPDLEGEELQELMRVLAVVVLNAHEDGCHGFGSLFNSHCTPNVEVCACPPPPRSVCAAECVCATSAGSPCYAPLPPPAEAPRGFY